VATSNPLTSPVSVLILAGGPSSRMGADKAWLEIDGQPMIARVLRRALPVAAETIISTNEPGRFRAVAEAFPLPALVVTDRMGAGPLAGLHAGLSVASHELVLALGTDMPFVDPEVLSYLIGLAGGYDAVVPQVVNRNSGAAELEPLHAVYRTSCLGAIERHLRAGHRRMVAFLPDVRTCIVPWEQIALLDPGFRSFLNINTPEDLTAARLLAKDLPE